MAVTAEREPTTPSRSPQPTTKAPHEESLTHFLARTGSIVFRWGVLIFLGVTVLTIFAQLYPLAAIPFALFVLNLLLLGIANYIEKRTYRPGDPHEETGDEQAEAPPPRPPSPKEVEKQQVNTEVATHTAKIIAGILVVATIMALAIAAWIFDPNLLIIGAFMFFAYIIFVTAPFWLGWLNDEAEVVEHDVEEKLHGNEQQ